MAIFFYTQATDPTDGRGEGHLKGRKIVPFKGGVVKESKGIARVKSKKRKIEEKQNQKPNNWREERRGKEEKNIMRTL